MDLTSTVAILASLAVILTFIWNVFFGRRTLIQLVNRWSQLSRRGDSGRVLGELPHRDYKILWGREEQLQKIAKLLQPYPKSRYHIIAIYGIAGIGKTSLALEVAHRIKEGKLLDQFNFNFDAIIWTSAKPSILSPEGIRSRDHYIQLIDDVYATIAVTLEHPHILQAKREQQAKLIRAALAKHRVLLILDNIEALSDERIISFIQEVPDPTKVIVTTRYRIGVAFPIMLQGLDRDSSHALIQKETEEFGGINLPKHMSTSIYERTGGVPLAMVWTLGRLRLNHEPEVVLRDLTNPSSDISRFCFEQSLGEIRGKKAMELLYAISIFRKAANKRALGAICDLENSELDLNDGIVFLTRLSLTNQENDRFTMLPLARAYIQEVVRKEIPSLGIHLKTRFAEYYVSLLRSQIGSGYWDGRIALNTWSRFGIIVDEIEEVQESVDLAFDLKLWNAVRDLVFGIVHILWVLDRWEQRIELTTMAIQAVQQLGLPEDEAWLRIDALGFIYLAQGDYDNAAKTIEDGLQIAESLGKNDAIVLGLCFKARVQAHLGNYDEAHKYLVRAKGLPADQWLKRRIDTTATVIEQKMPRRNNEGRNIPRSRKELEQERKQLKHVLAQARKLRSTGAFAEARDMLRIAEKIEDDMGDLDFRAQIRMELGLLELDSGNLDEAEQILRDVREVFIYLRKNEEVSAINKRLTKKK